MKHRERFMQYVDTAGDCWVWVGGHSATGYGAFWLNGKTVGAHRVSYELHVGPIPTGLHLDHLCRNPTCVNPEHLEPVTCAVNIRRGPGSKTHCKNGHPLSGENLYMTPQGRRSCRACHVIWSNDYRRRQGRQVGVGTTKLTEQDVREIRQAKEQGTKQTLLAKQYGVSDMCISDVVNRRRWAWLA